jgi:hypothetical protein
MIHLNIRLEIEDGAWPDLAGAPHGELERVATLKGGLQSGATSVTLVGRLDDGQPVVIETSLKVFLAAAVAVRARHGEEIGP